MKLQGWMVVAAGALWCSAAPAQVSTAQAHRRAARNDQARGPNRKGTFLRPADSPPDLNRAPRAMGSGAPSLPVDEEPSAQGRNYGRRGRRGRAGGVASGKGNPGGAASNGDSGKGAGTQPRDHDSEAGRSGEPPR